MSKSKLSLEQTMELAKVVATLEDVLNGLKNGSLTLQHGAESVTLTPPGVVELEMEASQKKDKEKLSIQIAWKKGAANVPTVTVG